MSEVKAIAGSPATDEELFYLKTSYEDPVASLGRLEECGKSLMTVAASISGVFVAALKLTLKEGDKLNPAWFVPFAVWAASVGCLIVVLVPQLYTHGKNQPKEIRATILQIRQFKYRWLVAGAMFFMTGVVVSAFLAIWVG